MVSGVYSQACFPQDALTENSLDICSKSGNKAHFTEVVNPSFIDDFQLLLQKIVSFWKEQKISESYMIIGQDQLQKNEKAFTFQAVPYQKASTWIGRFWQQFLVLWRFTFGGFHLTSGRVRDLTHIYHDGLNHTIAQTATSVEAISNCAFCRKETIDSQLVLDGNKVQVLYNYAPLGFGGEKLHFLVIPKEHRPTFEHLTQEEHREAFAISKFVVERLQAHFQTQGESLQKLYIYHKTGAEAGQSVRHWHLHLVLTQHAAQDFWGRLTVLRNMILGAIFSFRLSSAKLAEQKKKYTQILSNESL